MPEDQKTTARTDRILNASHDRPSLMQERRLKPHGDQIFKCPRCDSLNTKFCYYNNYSLSQPRHFCKSCKRYWTKGGALRNVPIGGGCRKNKSIKQRTAVDQCFPSSSSLTAEDQAIMRGGDGSSSSSPLQHEFSGSAPSPELYACSSPGLYGTDGQEGLGLAFERLDQTRAFSVNNAPIPVQWAPAQELLSTTPPSENSLNSFDSSILALTLTGHLNQNTKRLQNGELSSLLAAPPPSSLNDHNLAAPYNFCSLQSFGLPSSNGDLLQWRLPPRLLTLAEDNGRKGKLLSTEIDQTSSPADWRPPSDGFFELAMGDTGSDWSSHSWLPDMAMYGSMAGSQPL